MFQFKTGGTKLSFSMKFSVKRNEQKQVGEVDFTSVKHIHYSNIFSFFQFFKENI